MQALTSAFLGCRLNLRLAPAPKPNPEAPRQVTVCAKKKGVRCIVTLECTEARGLGATPSRYTTQKARDYSAACLAPSPAFAIVLRRSLTKRNGNIAIDAVAASTEGCFVRWTRDPTWRNGVSLACYVASPCE